MDCNLHHQLVDCNGGVVNSSPGGNVTNVIDFVTIATTGNATDFGDLEQSYY